jgi:predicted transcriptional regulator of viral defense system
MSSGVCHSTFGFRTRDDTRPDMRVVAIAREQHGVVSVGQLAALGLDSAAITRRVGSGRLHRVHRGVYAVGHDALTTTASFVAAVLAGGGGAVLSHHSAAVYWGFVRWDGRSPEVTVTGAQRRVPGLRVHRSRAVDRRDVMRRDGMLVTSPARTLLDLAAVVGPRELRRAARQAEAARHVNVRQLADVLVRAHGHRGAGALRRVVADGPAPTRSELEDIVLDLIDRAGIPRPQINAALTLDGRTVVPDFLWPEQRVILEADGAAYHAGALARAHDAERQALLEAHGYRVLRITWDQAVRHPRQTLARIRAALGR